MLMFLPKKGGWVGKETQESFSDDGFVYYFICDDSITGVCT